MNQTVSSWQNENSYSETKPSHWGRSTRDCRLRKVIRFYVEGFREMTVGRTLWAIILIKLFILFAVLKVFFFPDLLAGKSPSEKAGCVLENLTPEIPQP